MRKILFLSGVLIVGLVALVKPVLAFIPPIAGDTQKPVISAVYTSSHIVNNGGYFRIGVKATDNNYVVGASYLIDNKDLYVCNSYLNISTYPSKCEMMVGPFSVTSTVTSTEHRYDITVYDQNGNKATIWGKFNVNKSSFAGIIDRDQKRIADLKTLKDVLQTYRADLGQYPINNKPIVLGSVSASCLDHNYGWTSLGCSMSYINPVPTDPIGLTPYLYSSDGSAYQITAHLEGVYNGLSGDVVLTADGIKQK